MSFSLKKALSESYRTLTWSQFVGGDKAVVSIGIAVF